MDEIIELKNNIGHYTLDEVDCFQRPVAILLDSFDEIYSNVFIAYAKTLELYTEPDLITAMETAGKNIEDEEARSLMKLENKGLGTAATRAAIVNSLFSRNYLAKKGKSIYPTEKGIFIIDTLPVDELKSAELTGLWEKRLHEISIGNEDYNSFVSDIEKTVRDWYQKITDSMSTKYSDKTDNQVCPFCGARVIKGKFGYFCSAKKDNGCKFFVPSEICGKSISDVQARRLIEKGKTTLIKGLKSKSGKEFDAYLVVDKKQRKIVFEFPPQNKAKH